MKKITASKLAQSVEKDWGEWIKARAGYKCELCPNSRENGNQLHSHHIEAKQSIYMRLNENNGVCLCGGCHMSIHGQNGRTEQLKREERLKEVRGEEFLEKLAVEKHKQVKLTVEDVENFREVYKLKLKELS